MRFNIMSESDRRIPRKKILTLLAMIEDEEEPPESGLNLIFTHDRRMKNLNSLFRNKDKATDVLSFNIDSEPGVENVFGEIYISTDTASRNAEKFNRTLTDEILLLCCHGFLHLLGYDHEKDSDHRIMQEKENYYLGKLKR